MVKEKQMKIEELLGSKVGEYIDVADEKIAKMKPLVTIYGCEVITNRISLKTIDQYFEKQKDIYSVTSPKLYDYKIQYFGDVEGIQDVIKVETIYSGFSLQMFSQIYSPTFEEYGIVYKKDENNNSILVLGGGMSTIHLNKVYNKLKEIGVEIKTDFNIENSSSKLLQKKLADAKR